MSTTQFEEAIDGKVAEIAEMVESCDVYFREAAAKYAIRSLCWGLFNQAEVDNHTLEEHLETMAAVMKSAKQQDDEDRDPRD